MKFRGNIPTKFSLGIFRGDFRQTRDPRNFLGISSEICFLGIPSENSEGFPRKEEIPRNYFRRLVSSKETAACTAAVLFNNGGGGSKEAAVALWRRRV
ncbi:hypothetical protein DY000_02030243 [Brassica cretica]|uniref:Uncharacterized protein n=1 Tax=Brassica cretica TaxID=69181 RepID=A0ABQ7DI58_BRACR|nr:hypothetical protein DY000_02030243 [Brassica cretica]